MDPMSDGWKSFGLQMLHLRQADDLVSKQAMIEHRNRIKQLSSEQLAAALDECEGLAFGDDQARTMILSELSRELCAKDPLKLLEMAAGKPHDSWISHCASLGIALEKVASSSSHTAIQWLDAAIARGEFDYAGSRANNPRWVDFERALVSGLMTHDTAAGVRRIEGYPGEMKHDVLSRIGQDAMGNPEIRLSPGYYPLFRKYLDRYVLTNLVSTTVSYSLNTGGLNAVSDTMNQIGATPAERNAVAREITTRYLDRIPRHETPGLDEVETLRTWAASQPSMNAGMVTGRAIGYLAGNPQFGLDRAFEAIHRYQEQSPSDSMLAEFFGWSTVWKDPERCFALARQIQNEKLREKYLKVPQ